MAQSVDTKSKTVRTTIKNLRLNKEKGVIDVVGEVDSNFFLYLYKKGKIFIFKNTLYRSLFTVSLSLIIIVVFIAVKSHAEVAVFYPKTCLGGWENVANAQGKPNLDKNTKIEDFTKENSAVLVGLSEIYCGGFEGELPKDGDPKKLTLTFSWSVDNGTVVHNNASNIKIEGDAVEPEQSVEENNSSQEPVKVEDPAPTENTDTSSDLPSVEQPPAVVPDENTPISSDVQPAPTSESEESAPQSFLFDAFFKKVHAQEESPSSDAPTVPSQEITDPVFPTVELPQQDPSVPQETLDPTANKNDKEQDVSKTEDVPIVNNDISPENTETPTQEEKKSDLFMDVEYTIDGVEWKSLGTVGYSEWGRVSFNIPVTEWSDIEKLQIKLQPLQTIDTAPVVYVDGMTVEVNYGQTEEEKTVEETASDIKKYQILNITQAEKITVDTQKDPDQGVIVLLTPKDDGAFVVYSANDPQFSFTKSVSKDTTEEIPLYNFIPGEFTLIFTKRNDQCSGLTLDECRSDGQYIDEISFIIKPSSKTPQNLREITSVDE